MPGEPRALWASNRVCEAAVRHRKHEHHLSNLRHVKPMVDNRDPRRPKSSNSKGARLEEERNNQIMHENTILLNKLSRILTRNPEPVRDSILVRGLNDNQNRIERERIDRENQALLRRLQDVRPSHDAEVARQHYERHEYLIQKHAQQFVSNPFLGDRGGTGSSRGNSATRRPQSSSSSTLGVPALPEAEQPTNGGAEQPEPSYGQLIDNLLGEASSQDPDGGTARAAHAAHAANGSDGPE